MSGTCIFPFRPTGTRSYPGLMPVTLAV